MRLGYLVSTVVKKKKYVWPVSFEIPAGSKKCNFSIVAVDLNSCHSQKQKQLTHSSSYVVLLAT
jgi:hypothetical protein